jgi:hypothetical protein
MLARAILSVKFISGSRIALVPRWRQTLGLVVSGQVHSRRLHTRRGTAVPQHPWANWRVTWQSENFTPSGFQIAFPAPSQPRPRDGTRGREMEKVHTSLTPPPRHLRTVRTAGGGDFHCVAPLRNTPRFHIRTERGCAAGSIAVHGGGRPRRHRTRGGPGLWLCLRAKAGGACRRRRAAPTRGDASARR